MTVSTEFRFNPQPIRDLQTQIETITDCRTILFNIELGVQAAFDYIETAIENSAQLNELFGPLGKIPTTLDEVIKWIKAITLGDFIKQLKSAIELAVSAIECAEALVDLIKSIEAAAERLPECFAQIPSVLENSVKQGIDNSVANIVGPSLNKVKEISDAINDIAPGLVNIDTSSPENFLNSLQNNPINTPDFVQQAQGAVFQYQNLSSRFRNI